MPLPIHQLLREQAQQLCHLAFRARIEHQDRLGDELLDITRRLAHLVDSPSMDLERAQAALAAAGLVNVDDRIVRLALDVNPSQFRRALLFDWPVTMLGTFLTGWLAQVLLGLTSWQYHQQTHTEATTRELRARLRAAHDRRLCEMEQANAA